MIDEITDWVTKEIVKPVKKHVVKPTRKTIKKEVVKPTKRAIKKHVVKPTKKAVKEVKTAPKRLEKMGVKQPSVKKAVTPKGAATGIGVIGKGLKKMVTKPSPKQSISKSDIFTGAKVIGTGLKQMVTGEEVIPGVERKKIKREKKDGIKSRGEVLGAVKHEVREHVISPTKEHVIKPVRHEVKEHVISPAKEHVIEPTKEHVIEPTKELIKEKKPPMVYSTTFGVIKPSKKEEAAKPKPEEAKPKPKPKEAEPPSMKSLLFKPTEIHLKTMGRTIGKIGTEASEAWKEHVVSPYEDVEEKASGYFKKIIPSVAPYARAETPEELLEAVEKTHKQLGAEPLPEKKEEELKGVFEKHYEIGEKVPEPLHKVGELGAGVKAGAVEEVRQKPIKTAVLAGLGTAFSGIGAAWKGAGLATKLPKVTKWTPRIAGGVMTAGYGALVGEQLYKAPTMERKGEVLGKTGVELAAMGVGFKTGSALLKAKIPHIKKHPAHIKQITKKHPRQWTRKDTKAIEEYLAKKQTPGSIGRAKRYDKKGKIEEAPSELVIDKPLYPREGTLPPGQMVSGIPKGEAVRFRAKARKPKPESELVIDKPLYPREGTLPPGQMVSGIPKGEAIRAESLLIRGKPKPFHEVRLESGIVGRPKQAYLPPEQMTSGIPKGEAVRFRAKARKPKPELVIDKPIYPREVSLPPGQMISGIPKGEAVRFRAKAPETVLLKPVKTVIPKKAKPLKSRKALPTPKETKLLPERVPEENIFKLVSIETPKPKPKKVPTTKQSPMEALREKWAREKAETKRKLKTGELREKKVGGQILLQEVKVKGKTKSKARKPTSELVIDKPLYEVPTGRIKAKGVLEFKKAPGVKESIKPKEKQKFYPISITKEKVTPKEKAKEKQKFYPISITKEKVTPKEIVREKEKAIPKEKYKPIVPLMTKPKIPKTPKMPKPLISLKPPKKKKEKEEEEEEEIPWWQWREISPVLKPSKMMAKVREGTITKKWFK